VPSCTSLPRAASLSLTSVTHFSRTKPFLELAPKYAWLCEVSSLGWTPRLAIIAQISLSGYKRHSSGRTTILNTGAGLAVHCIGTMSPGSRVCQYSDKNQRKPEKRAAGTAVGNGTLLCFNLWGHLPDADARAAALRCSNGSLGPGCIQPDLTICE